MKQSNVRVSRKRSWPRVRRLGTGCVMLGLAMSASANDVSSPGGAKTKAGTTASDRGAAGMGGIASGMDVQPLGNLGAKPGAALRGSSQAKPKAKRWYQVGVASWYGARFQGRRTAGGERFDMNTMTCAHPTLPMGTWLRVTNLKNRQTAFVRVNDRGPLLQGRIVDLSFAAARLLGLANLGHVKLEAVRAGDRELAEGLMAQLQMPGLFGMLAR